MLQKQRILLFSSSCSSLLSFLFLTKTKGVREFTADNHGTSALCMKELRKCLDSSIGPAFVCLLGDKYGYLFSFSFILF